jgi:uncharacterized protein (TIGR03089 family)
VPTQPAQPTQRNLPTPWDLLDTQLRRDGTRPFLTFYDAAEGERVELSVTTTANWVAKTANYLIDELGADPGDTLSVRLPLHWNAAIFLLAGWAAGLEVVNGPADIVVTTEGSEFSGSRDTVTLTLAPMGVDFSRLVAAQPDGFFPTEPSGAHEVEIAASHATDGDRVLITDPLDGPELFTGLLAPLAAGGSVVYVRHAESGDLEAIKAAERVTATFTNVFPVLLKLRSELDEGPHR